MMIKQLHTTCRELLESGKVQVIIGYGRNQPGQSSCPIFVAHVDQVERLVWDDSCTVNLATYLTHKDVKAMGKVAVVVKGCDAKAIVVLTRESQIDRSQIVVIGMACEGVGNPREPKCATCDVHMPKHTDMVIGEVKNEPVAAEQRYADLQKLMAKSPDERMAYWQDELDRCVKCYACRQVCPMCYCERCVVDKNRPARISTSATLKGNYAWHITRAFHLAGRCIGCDECTRACPAGIDLRLLNLSLARVAEESFDYRAGIDPEVDPLIGSFSEKDKEGFIG